MSELSYPAQALKDYSHAPLLRESESFCFMLEGCWVSENIDVVDRLLDEVRQRQLSSPGDVIFKGDKCFAFDTAAALLLLRFEADIHARRSQLILEGFSSEALDLIELVRSENIEHVTALPSSQFLNPLVLMGAWVSEFFKDMWDLIGFLGAFLSAFCFVFLRPSLWRPTSVITHMDHAGLKAVPIIVLINFIIGAIVAQQSAFQLRTFGADIFTVDLIGILVFREVGVLISSIMVAGRTGSSYTAELGSMKMREEIDAMRVIGLNAHHVLIMPRILALIIVMPLLAFIANIAAILGAMLILWSYSGIQPTVFIERLHEAVWLETVLVGFIKAPFMGIIIGLIACLEGLRVRGSAESLGQQVTASVVKSIFMVIVIDGIFAMFFAAIDY